MTRPPGLADCPAELQLYILSFLSSADLISMTRSCKAFGQLAEPVLYSTITLRSLYRRIPQVVPLLRTLLHRPQLSHHIRNLSLNGNLVSWRLISTLPIDTLPLDKAAEVIRSTGLPDSCSETWLQDVKLDTLDALVTLLLFILPRLTHLRLGPVFAFQNPLLGTLLHHCLCKPKSAPDRQLLMFAYLQSAVFYRSASKNEANLAPCFYLPQLQHLSIGNKAELPWPASSGPPHTTTLSSLELWWVREPQLEAVLTPLVCLRKLQWHIWVPETSDVINLDAISTCLIAARSTLQDLTIRANADEKYTHDGDTWYSRVQIQGSLDLECMRLKTLCVPWAMLMGLSPKRQNKLFTGLPSSLQVLNLTFDLVYDGRWNWFEITRWHDYDYESDDNHDPYSIVSALTEGLNSMDRSALPMLHKVTFNGELETTETHMEALRQSTRQSGIQVFWFDSDTPDSEDVECE